MERALLAGMEGKSLEEIEAALADDEELAERRGAHGAELTERR
jgi:molecular chaperone HscA